MFDNTNSVYKQFLNIHAKQGNNLPDHTENYLGYYGFFRDICIAANTDVEEINNQSGLKLTFSCNKDESINDVVMRKAILYPKISVFTFEQDIVLGSGGETCCADYDPKYFDRLFEIEPLVRSGVATLLPRNVISDNWIKRKNSFSINESLKVSMTNKELQCQLTEEENRGNKGGTYVHLLLPELRHIPIDVLTKVRQDEGDAFDRFQGQLENLLVRSPQINSEAKLLDLMKTVDCEIHTLDNKFNSLKKSRALQAYGTLVGLVSLGICLLAPKEIASYIAALFGTKSILDGFRFIAGSSGPMDTAKGSDFYLPWRLSKIKIEPKE